MLFLLLLCRYNTFVFIYIYIQAFLKEQFRLNEKDTSFLTQFTVVGNKYLSYVHCYLIDKRDIILNGNEIDEQDLCNVINFVKLYLVCLIFSVYIYFNIHKTYL